MAVAADCLTLREIEKENMWIWTETRKYDYKQWHIVFSSDIILWKIICG